MCGVCVCVLGRGVGGAYISKQMPSRAGRTSELRRTAVHHVTSVIVTDVRCYNAGRGVRKKTKLNELKAQGK